MSSQNYPIPLSRNLDYSQSWLTRSFDWGREGR